MKTLLKDLAVFLLILVLGMTGCAAPTTQSLPAQTSNPPSTPMSVTITYENNECIYEGPQPIPSGREIAANWVAKDTEQDIYYFEAVTLVEGKTKEYLVENYGPSFAGAGHYETAAAVEVSSGGSKQYSIRTTKGPIYIVCFDNPTSAGTYHFIGPIEVAGTTETQPSLTPASIPVTGDDAADNPLAKAVLDMAERLNAGDLEGSVDYFADDSVTYFVGMPPTGIEIYRGKEGIRPLWEECIGSHFKMEIEIVSVVGNVVNARSKTWHDFTRQLGVAPNEFVETYVVKDGKIALYSSVLTEKSLAKFKPALAAVMPPEPTAAPSTATPVSEINVIISDDTCSYEGVLVLKAGEVNVTVDVKDADNKTYGLTFFTLDAGKDIVDLMAATPLPSPPSWAKMLTLWEVNTSQTNTLTVKEGPLYLVCWSKPPDLAVGNVGPFEVK